MRLLLREESNLLAELLYSLSSIAMIFWVMLIVLPKWKVTRFLVNLHVFPIYLGFLYSIGMITTVWSSGLHFMADYNSAAGVINLLSHPNFALIVWIHILCFDLFVGHLIYRENMEHGYVPILLQSIILFLTLMFGPFGWLCYVGIRKLKATV
jgi:hypothetical protein